MTVMVKKNQLYLGDWYVQIMCVNIIFVYTYFLSSASRNHVLGCFGYVKVRRWTKNWFPWECWIYSAKFGKRTKQWPFAGVSRSNDRLKELNSAMAKLHWKRFSFTWKTICTACLSPHFLQESWPRFMSQKKCWNMSRALKRCPKQIRLASRSFHVVESIGLLFPNPQRLIRSVHKACLGAPGIWLIWSQNPKRLHFWRNLQSHGANVQWGVH